MEKIFDLLEDFIEGQLEVEPEHYPFTARELNTVCDKLRNGTSITTPEKNLLIQVLITIADLNELSSEEKAAILDIIAGK